MLEKVKDFLVTAFYVLVGIIMLAVNLVLTVIYVLAMIIAAYIVIGMVLQFIIRLIS